jgi:hypothetical protein
MKCLTMARLYDYLEGLLEEQEKKKVDRHLRACSRCRQVAEDRRRMLEAFRTLPSLKLPADFTGRVMEAAFPRKRPQPRWLWGLAAGLASLLLFSALLAVLSARSWPELMADSSRMLWGVLQSGLTIVAKAVRLIATLFKVMAQLVQTVWQGLNVLAELISPAALVLTLSGLIFVTAASYFGFRKLLIRR